MPSIADVSDDNDIYSGICAYAMSFAYVCLAISQLRGHMAEAVAHLNYLQTVRTARGVPYPSYDTELGLSGDYDLTVEKVLRQAPECISELDTFMNEIKSLLL